MRMIGSIPPELDAERFSDYLVAQNIANMVEQSAQGEKWDVWVENDDDVHRAKSEMDAFLRDPRDTKYNAKSAAQEIRDERQQQKKKKRARYIDFRTQGGQTHQYSAPLTITLIVLSVLVSFGTNSVGIGTPRQNLIDLVRFTPVNREVYFHWIATHMRNEDQWVTTLRYWLSYMKAGQVWRLITPIFIHYSPLHLIFNMFWLYDLGMMIEMRRGTWKLLALVLLSALIPNFAQFLWGLPQPAGFGGMSGVVYGLFGYVWMKYKFEPQLGLGIGEQTVWIMIGWLFLCMTGVLGPVANAAHVVGLLAGCAFATIPVGYRRVQRRMRS